MGRVVLVTGLSRDIASRFARLLAGQEHAGDIDKVVGVDVVPPHGDLGGVKFVRADIRTPVIAKVIAVEDVDTVVHLDIGPTIRGRAGSKELNVIGSMQLLAACQQVASVRSFVLGSTTAVYGTSPRNPAMFTESSAPRSGVSSGYPKDSVEVEAYVRGFARRRPDVEITTLRLAQVLDLGGSLASYFATPLLPAVLGFDPRLQFLHPDDALEVLRRAVLQPVPGTFNVAGPGVMLLSQAARRLGKPTLPLPPIGFGSAARRLVRVMGSEISPDLHRLLMYGRVVDTTALRTIFGYEPAYTTPEAFEMFRSSLQPGLLSGLGGAS